MRFYNQNRRIQLSESWLHSPFRVVFFPNLFTEKMKRTVIVATYSVLHMLILVLVIFLTFSRVSEARLLQGRHHQSIVHQRVDSKHLLNQILARYQVNVHLDGNGTDRKVPGGPDGQHH